MRILKYSSAVVCQYTAIDEGVVLSKMENINAGKVADFGVLNHLVILDSIGQKEVGKEMSSCRDSK